MKASKNRSNHFQAAKAMLATAALMPALALAAYEGSPEGKVCEFLKNINTILNVSSIAVVTIAIVFAGYQIAFAHKRISDVAPILIGGLLIGAAGQIATMVIGEKEECRSETSAIVEHVVARPYA